MGEVDLREIIHRGDGDVGGDMGGVEGAIVDDKVDSTHVALRLYGFISVPTSNTSMYAHVTEVDILEYTYIQYVAYIHGMNMCGEVCVRGRVYMIAGEHKLQYT